MKNLKVILVDETVADSNSLHESLQAECFEVVAHVSFDEDLISQLKKNQPDVMVLNMEEPDDMVFDQLIEINEQHPVPVVFFADKGESSIIKKAVRAGVGAFVIDGLSARKLRPVIEVAIERFKAMQQLQNELQATKSRLEDRKVIEKAKGILMQRKQIAEDDAYQSLRKLAMEQNKKLVDVARSTIELAELFN